MAIVSKPVRINTDDFPDELKAPMEMVADTVNPALEQIYLALNGTLNFNNLGWGLLTNFIVKVDANGALIVDGSDARLTRRVQNPAKGPIQGSLVIRASCLDNPSLNPLSTPFLSFNQNADGSLQLSSLSGIQPNLRYQISVIFFSN